MTMIVSSISLSVRWKIDRCGNKKSKSPSEEINRKFADPTEPTKDDDVVRAMEDAVFRLLVVIYCPGSAEQDASQNLSLQVQIFARPEWFSLRCTKNLFNFLKEMCVCKYLE